MAELMTVLVLALIASLFPLFLASNAKPEPPAKKPNIFKRYDPDRPGSRPMRPSLKELPDQSVWVPTDEK